MELITFDIRKFPRFRRICMALWAVENQKHIDTFNQYGFKTATPVLTSAWEWQLSEQEYTWFALTWS